MGADEWNVLVRQPVSTDVVSSALRAGSPAREAPVVVGISGEARRRSDSESSEDMYWPPRPRRRNVRHDREGGASEKVEGPTDWSLLTGSLLT